MIIIFLCIAFVVLVMAEDHDSYIMAIIITVLCCLSARPESIVVGLALAIGLIRMTK